jgi:integrase
LVPKGLDWIREEKSGRLIYRRHYPKDVRKVLGKLEKKVPLESRWRLTETGSAIYHRACAEFDREVREARLSLELAAKRKAAAHDPITPEVIERIVHAFRYQRHAANELLMMAGGDGSDRATGALDWMISEFQEWKIEADYEQMEEHWGRIADKLLADACVYPDPLDVAGRERLLWALNDAGMLREAADRLQLAGKAVEAPATPQRPKNPRGRAKTVSALIDAYKADKWDGWSLSSRAAVEAPFRILREVIGDQPVTEIDREAAREIFSIVKSLPSGLGKNKDLKGLSILAAVERGRALGVPVLGPKTINGSYMGHISAAFGWAEKEEWLVKNPFVGLTAADPVADQDKRDAFTALQLSKLFSSAPWNKPQGSAAKYPGRYWIPLIALFTGMRLAEIGGLRVMDAEVLDGFPSLRVRPHELRSIKTKESRRDIPVPQALKALGLLGYIKERQSSAAPEDLLFPDVRTNVNGKVAAKIGEWFVGHLKASGIVGTKLGVHSFRHSFEDRLKAAGVSGSAEALAVSGRTIRGSQSIYGVAGAAGGGFPLSNLLAVLELVQYAGLDLTHLSTGHGDSTN